MDKNHFFIVGAQRSATTYLYNLLDEHPEVCMAKPVKPEPKYFLDKTDEVFDINEYVDKYFSGATNKTKVYGEKSTSYYENKTTARYISENMPGSKIIFILANPVLRAISNYRFSVDNGIEKRSIEDVFLNDTRTPLNKFDNISVNPFDYLERGIYYKFIKNYYDSFSRKDVLVLLKDEFVNNDKSIQELYKFLNIDDAFIPEGIEEIVNSSKIKKDIPYEVMNFLNEYYSEPNEYLKKLLNRKEILWQ